MDIIRYFLPLVVFLFTGCSHTPIIVDPPKELKAFEDTIMNERYRHPTCDPHPYIYGSDEQGFWRSNGCSREYIHEDEAPHNHNNYKKGYYGN